MSGIKDFVQTNFPELLLTLILVATVIVLLASIHWHDDTTAAWARSLIGAIVVGITTLINSLKQPKPNGTVTSTSTSDNKEHNEKTA